MSDLKLFQLNGQDVQELKGEAAKIEKSLQSQMEANLDTYLGVRFLDTEYPTGANHGGRIDTLGIDENGSPVIIEYKRAMNQNVINQGLFYLDWLMDHKAEFELLVMRQLSKKDSETIDWNNPRLLCIAGDFTKFDEHAVKQMNRNIELIRYRKFGEDLLLLELVNVAQATNGTKTASNGATPNKYKTVEDYLQDADQELTDLYYALREHLLNLGDDVQEKKLKYYIAFKRIRNFVCVQIHPQKHKVTLYLNHNPDEVDIDENWMSDVREVGHQGTGDLELTVRHMEDLDRAEKLLLEAYERS
jgi:predicted transport protein